MDNRIGNEILIILVLSLISIVCVSGMYWLGIGIFIFLSIFLLLKTYCVLRLNFIFLCFMSILGALFLAFLLRSFIFEIYNIPSNSMENTLVIGDKILMSKLDFGPKTTLLEKRLSGFSRIKRGDLIVFQGKGNNDEKLIKRCVGLPGSVFEMRAGEVFLNNSIFISDAKQDYEVYVNNKKNFITVADSMKLNYFFNESLTPKSQSANVILTTGEKEKIRSLSFTDSIRYRQGKEGLSLEVTTWGKDLKWDRGNFGPVLIPGKGIRINLSAKNYIIYKDIIETTERVSIVRKDDGIYLDGLKAAGYTFKNDYYFVLGDNRNVSVDSRFLGFIPESDIDGKAILVLFSNEQFDVKWKRILNSLH